jgi:hypothetical protein
MRLNSPHLLLSLASLSLTAPTHAQSVPGFTVEVFSTPTSPNLLAFGPDGTLFAGRDDDPLGSITPTFVTRIAPDGFAEPDHYSALWLLLRRPEAAFCGVEARVWG